MEEKYIEYIKAFKNLDIEDKRFELVKNARELLQLIYNTNYVLNENNKALPILNNYDNEDEFLNQLFTYIISLKEENAKLIEYIFNKSN